MILRLTMKDISILLLHQANLASIENARLGFLEANHFLKNQGNAPAFRVKLTGLQQETTLNSGMYKVQADRLIHNTPRTDIIIIPAIRDDIPEAMEQNHPFFPWINQQYQSGAEVASLCLGAFILAGTGLLDGKSCVTHWRAMHDFGMLFPHVTPAPNRILTEEQGIYTSGGAFSAANLVLYLIEKHAGRDAAIYCSKIFQVDWDRSSQSPFIIFAGEKDHGDEIVQRAQEFIERQFREKITVSLLCEKLAVGRRTFERRFKRATGNTVVEYIQRVKVEAAKKELESGKKSVYDVTFEVGYTDGKAFRNVFRKYAGMTPVAYRNKYNAA